VYHKGLEVHEWFAFATSLIILFSTVHHVLHRKVATRAVSTAFCPCCANISQLASVVCRQHCGNSLGPDRTNPLNVRPSRLNLPLRISEQTERAILTLTSPLKTALQWTKGSAQYNLSSSSSSSSFSYQRPLNLSRSSNFSSAPFGFKFQALRKDVLKAGTADVRRKYVCSFRSLLCLSDFASNLS